MVISMLCKRLSCQKKKRGKQRRGRVETVQSLDDKDIDKIEAD